MKKFTRMQSILFTLLLSISVTITTNAQIVIGQDTLIGNEWIDYDQSYFKMMLAEDGLYRVSYEELQAAGVPVQSLSGAALQVYYFGQEQAISVSTSGAFGSGDYIEFVGVKNRGELDKHLYREESDQLNPRYSLYSDTSAYFLTWEQGVAGKRLAEQTVDLTGNTIAPEAFYMHEDVVVFSSRVNKPSFQQDVRFSQYLPGEGFCGNLLPTNTFNHTVNNIFENGPAPSLNIRLSGNNLLHKIDVSVDNNVKLTAEFIKNETKQYSIDLDNNDVTNGLNSVSVKSYQSSSDKNTIANSVLRYSRNFDFGNADFYQFEIEGSDQNKYIEISNFDLSSGGVSLIDIDNSIVYAPIVEDGLLKVLLPASTEERSFILSSDSGRKNILRTEPIEMIDYSQMGDVEYIMYTSKALDKNHTDGTNYLRAYRDHRASDLGGSFTAAIVFAEDLYNQFSYGVNRHPISLKNHARWVEDNWTNAKYNFLLGKGVEYTSSRIPFDATDPDNAVAISSELSFEN